MNYNFQNINFINNVNIFEDKKEDNKNGMTTFNKAGAPRKGNANAGGAGSQ
jgi:hypothetical protein